MFLLAYLSSISCPVPSPPRRQKAINESQCSYLLPSNLDCSARRPRQLPPLPVIDCWARHHNGPLTCSTVSDADIKHVLHNGQIGCYDFSWNFRPSKVWWQRKRLKGSIPITLIFRNYDQNAKSTQKSYASGHEELRIYLVKKYIATHRKAI